MTSPRKPYPSDVYDEELAHDLRAVLRRASGRDEEPSAAVLDSRTLRSTPESRARAGYDGAKRKKGSKLHLAVDTLDHLQAAHVTPATADDRAEVGRLAQAVQAATGESVDLASVDQGYTGERAAAAARAAGIELEEVKLPAAKRSFVLLPRRWLVEPTFGWAIRFRRLGRDDERLPQTLADVIIVMRDGMVEQAGTPLELYDYPINTFVAGFIGSHP